MIGAAAVVLGLILALAVFLFTRRRFSPGNVVGSAVKFVGVLAPIAVLAGAVSLLPRPTLGTYLVVLPVGIAYLFWLDLTHGVSARMSKFPARRQRAGRGAAQPEADPSSPPTAGIV